MIRTFLTPDGSTISLEIPMHYVGKQLEVIIFAKDECVPYPTPKDSSYKTLSVSEEEAKYYKFSRDDTPKRQE